MEPNPPASSLNSPPPVIVEPSPALSQSSTVYDATPRPPRHRTTFARLASVDSGQYTAVKGHEDDITEATPYNDHQSNVRGLGIDMSNDSRGFSPAPSSTELKSGYDVENHDLGSWTPRSAMKRSVTSFGSSMAQNTEYIPDTQKLQNRKSFAESLRMVYDGEFASDVILSLLRLFTTA